VGFALALLSLLAGGAILGTCNRLFPYYYDLALRRIHHGSEALLYAGEERLQQLIPFLPVRFWGAASGKPSFRTLGERLEFCAYHLDGLRQLERDPERRPRGVALSERAREAAQHANDGLIVVCCLLGRLIFVAVSLLYAPRIIRAHADLAAFIDYRLLRLGLPLAQLPPPPPEPRGWLARTIAPWRTPPVGNTARW
jgi:hypothetical protein